MYLDVPNQVDQHSLDISPDGALLATLPNGPEKKQVKIWDLTSGELVQTYSIPTAGDEVHEVDFFSPDGKRLALPGEDGGLTILDLATSQEILTLTGSTNYIASIHFSPDGERIYAVDDDRYLNGWDATSGEQLFRIPGTATNWFAISPDGTQVAASTESRELRFYDALSGTQLSQFTCHRAPNDIAFSPDGERLVTGSVVAGAVWDTTSKEKVFDLNEENPFLAVRYSPDGRTIATGSYDGVVKLWDAETGQELVTLGQFSLYVFGIDFSPDGKTVAASSWNGIMRTYILDIDDFITVAKARLTRSFSEGECPKYLHTETCPDEP